MTRTPRTARPADRLRTLGERVSKTTARKTLAYAGAGLALAGAGAAIATASLTGGTASASGQHGTRPAVTVSRHASAHPKPSAPATAPRTRGIVSRQTALTQAATRTHGRTAGKAAAQPANQPGHTADGKARHAKHASEHARTWAAVSRVVASQTYPKAPSQGQLPAQDQLTPAGLSGPQSWLPVTQARYGNAKAIIRQVLAKHMGVRAAVVAVATSMQESGLLNVSYGTSDSLGLFQQRPSMGWGTPSQIMHPAYAADAFLKALRGYEARDPGWARQPVWQSAQGVQASAYPYAYAKWEAQAAHLVAVITPHLA